MKAVLIFLAFVASCSCSVLRNEGRSFVSRAQCWAGANQHGEMHLFNDNNPHLGGIGFDNTIESVQVTGMWMFYEEVEYSARDPSYMCYVHGIDYFMNLPPACSNMASSIRYACHPTQLNGDCWSVYAMTYFRGESMYGTENMPDLSYLSLKVSSLILTGRSSWEVCSGLYYSGTCVCLQPDTVHDYGDGKRLDLGIFEELPGFADNHVKSIRKGCVGGDSSNNIKSNTKLLNLNYQENGAYGVIKMY